MLRSIHFLKISLLIFSALFIISCENTDNKQSIKQIAITLIANYADGTGQTPTIRNYEDAGIIGVNAKNIDELNAFIETLNSTNVDTEEELNAVIDALGVSIASDIFAPVITLHGSKTLTLEVGDTYTKICATAIDNRDGEVLVYVDGDVDTSKIGRYIVTYSAIDEANNLGTLDRIITVIEAIPTATYSIGGTITGISSPRLYNPLPNFTTYSGPTPTPTPKSITLQNNGRDNITLTQNGTFTFPTKLLSNGVYNITILSISSGGNCTLSNATGTVTSSNISNILVSCSFI